MPMATRRSRARISRQLTNTFAAIDANGDGGLSMSELQGQRAIFRAARQEMKANGTANRMIRVPKAVMKHFDRIDANGDGRLSNDRDRQGHRPDVHTVATGTRTASFRGPTCRPEPSHQA